MTRTSWGITEYGNYYGSTPILQINSQTGEKIKKAYDYTLPAVDAVDNLAKIHDISYDKVGAVGSGSLFGDWGTTAIDMAAANGWSEILGKYKEGDKDPFNGQKISADELGAAWRGFHLFTTIVNNKLDAISTFMKENYKKEASQSGGITQGNTNKDLRLNYQLFLQKYMHKDSEGYWKRNENMWNKDKEGNWTTPKTAEELKK